MLAHDRKLSVQASSLREGSCESLHNRTAVCCQMVALAIRGQRSCAVECVGWPRQLPARQVAVSVSVLWCAVRCRWVRSLRQLPAKGPRKQPAGRAARLLRHGALQPSMG